MPIYTLILKKITRKNMYVHSDVNSVISLFKDMNNLSEIN